MTSIHKPLLLALLALVVHGAYAQAPAAGRLLVSSPTLDDVNFSESVLLLLIHEVNSGSAGILLNRPTWVDPVESFPEIDVFEAYDDALYLVGPVAPTELVALLEFDGLPPEGVRPILDTVYFSTNPEILSEIDFSAADRPRVRVYAGRAEWGPGQLAEEIAHGRWRVLRAEPEHVFAEDAAGLWQHMPLTGDAVTASLE